MQRISVLVFGNSLRGRITSCLAEDPSVDVHLFSDTLEDPGRFSRCCRSFSVFRRPLPDEELMADLRSIVRQRRCDVILPVNNADVRFIAAHFKDLLPHVLVCFHPEPNVFEMVNDKWLLHNFLKEQQLPSPKTVLVDTGGSYMKHISEMTFPVILKMRRGDNALNMKSYQDFATISAAREMLRELAGEAIMQQYVPGSDIDCSFLARDGAILYHSMQTTAVTRRDPFKTDRVVKFLDDAMTLQTVGKLVKDLKFSGIAHLDMRIERGTGARMVVDFNARYWGSVCGSAAAGINFPLLACYTALGRPVALPAMIPIHYIWPAETVLRGVRRFFFRRVEKFPYSRSALRFYLKDPLVYIALLMSRLKKPKSLIKMFYPR